MPVKCLECGIFTTDDVTPVCCATCKSTFHPTCVQVNQNGAIIDCRNCLSNQPHGLVPAPDAPKSDRHKALTVTNAHATVTVHDSPKNESHKAVSLKSNSSRHSRASQVIQMEIKLLEDKRKLEADAEERLNLEREKYFAEKEQAIKSKLAKDLHYLKEKSMLQRELEEIDARTDRSSVSSQKLSEERIKSWRMSASQPNETQLKIGAIPKEGHFSGDGQLDADNFQIPRGSSTVNHLTKNIHQSTSAPHRVTRDSITARNSDMKNLPYFSGEAKEWPVFIKQFEESTELCQFSDSDNIVRLRNCLRGSARRAVQGALSFPDNVSHIIQTLSNLFGRPEFILNELIQEARHQPQIRLDRFEDIIHYSVIINNMCCTMVSAKMSEHVWNPILLQELINKLPAQMKREWAQYRNSLTAASIETFNHWLSQRSLESSSLLTEPPSFIDHKIKKNVNVHNVVCCKVCQGTCTTVDRCERFQTLSYKEKWKFVKSEKLCRICLRRHKERKCSAVKSCDVDGCPYFHHPKLHKTRHDCEKLEGTSEVVNAHRSSRFQGLLFKILPVKLHYNGSSLDTYALLDSGSSITLIEQWVTDELNVQGEPDELCLRWTGSTHKVEKNSKRISIEISGFGKEKFSLSNARTVQSLNLPRQSVSSNDLSLKYEHLRNIPITSYFGKQPSLLIGLDNVKLTTSLKLAEGRLNEPVAAKTRLGWVVFGGSNYQGVFHSYHTCSCQHSIDLKMDQLLKNFIALENLMTEKPSSKLMSPEDERALQIMKNTTTFLGDRYEIGLIWKYDTFSVPDSYSMALRRLVCLEKSLIKNPTLAANFQNQILEYVSKGYATKLDVSKIDPSAPSWYLPIFAVENPNKPGKVRIVWDAASSVDDVSLNTLLLKGPDLLTNLPGVLFRFRQFKVGIAGDIKQMFHQIRIKAEDRKFLKFLWREPSSGNVEVYQMNVMIFGASCAPSCSQFVKNLNADQFSQEMPSAVHAIKNNHYVDDWLESVEDEQEAIDLIKNVSFIHKQGGFHICNFLSNSSFVLENSTDVNPVTSKMFHEDGDNSEKLLGMWWEMKSDQFIYSLKYHKVPDQIINGERFPTKREVLKLLMSIFDPLGLIAHFLIFPKILLQEIWKSGIGWDEIIPDQLNQKWSTWIKTLPEVENIHIPRWYGLSSQDFGELHIFADASRDAFAAAAYLRICKGSEVKCSLVCAKTKVAPLKLLSIPRLELSAAVLGCRLAQNIVNNHSITFSRILFWTDSKTVWCWINSNHRNFKQYVAFRVAEILETSEAGQWRWIPTSENVADIATRQSIPSNEDHKRWFNGPSFLYNVDEDSWPPKLNEEKTTEELRPHILYHCEVQHCIVDYKRFSKWQRLTRCLGYVRKFLNQITFKTSTKRLSREEILFGELECFRIAQREEYPDEIADIQNMRCIPKSSPLYKLSAVLDDDGILRCKSRLTSMENMPEDFIHPIILPGNHYIVQLLIKYYHEKYGHQNHNTVFHEIQQKFYIISLRNSIKSVRTSCQRCKNNKAKPIVPIMGNLPKARLTPFTRPFTYIGIDYFGPYFVAVGRRREKRWGVLITCLNTRAVYLDICETLSTDSCICALKRFMARRGQPLEIFSDQGTNFKGTSNELQKAILKLDQIQLADEFTSSKMQWNFNPPLAPHMGGVWERLVRSAKIALDYAMSVSSRIPREDLLRTMLCEAEFTMNSRPLTYIPLDSDAADVLTPNHFILGSSNGINMFGYNSNEPKFLLENWKRSNQLMAHYWKRWIREYLPVIRRKTKWFENVRELEVGDIVIMVEDNFEKHLWRKARVVDIKRSPDGHVRKVVVQTANHHLYERAASKLALLDVTSKDKVNASTHQTYALPGGSVASNRNSN